MLGADGLELDEALLTGEAEPVRKQPGDTVLSGSAVVAGAGLIRADRVGGDAYAARLQAQARRFSLIRSELQQGTNQILRLVTWVMVPAGAMGLWVLVLVAGRPTASRIVLIAAMAAGLVPLFAIPAARRVLALQLPPTGILAAVAGVVLAAILALTLWRRASRSMPSQSSSS